MPVYITWGNDDRTFLSVKFVSPWTASELLNMIDEGFQIITSVSHTVDVIVDFHEAAKQIPTQYMPVVRRMDQIGRLNRGLMVVVGAPFFIRSLMKFAQEVAPDAYSNLHFAPDYKAAHALLEKQKQVRC